MIAALDQRRGVGAARRGGRRRADRPRRSPTYLTIVHYAGGSPVCAIAHGCATVQKSRYAEFAGVPVAVLGLLGYVGILALARQGHRDDPHRRGVPRRSSGSRSAAG